MNLWITQDIHLISATTSDTAGNPGQWPTPQLKQESQPLPPQKELIPNLSQKYQVYTDVFKKKNVVVSPQHQDYNCPITLPSTGKIPVGNIYVILEPELATLQEYLWENLAQEFIRKFTSYIEAPIIFIKKKDGSLHLSVVNWTLNQYNPQSVSLDLLSQLKTSRIFTKIDLRWSYNLVQIRAGDEWKTTLQTWYGHFGYLVALQVHQLYSSTSLMLCCKTLWTNSLSLIWMKS